METAPVEPSLSQPLPFDAEAVRAREFSRLGDTVYLDNAGSALYAESQINAFQQACTSTLFGNPHSMHDASVRSTREVESARDAVLQFFNTSRKEYSVIFTSGATAALKLVGESFAWSSGSMFFYLRHCHNSVLGIREYASDIAGCSSAAIDWEQLAQLPSQSPPAASLVAFPAQCNFSGEKYDLSILQKFQSYAKPTRWYTLLDAASWVSTSVLDLSSVKPDFACISFYKIFGFPTGLGCLLARNDSLKLLKKRYFGGGTVAASLSSERFHELRSDIRRFEDGTIDFLGIAALKHGFAQIRSLGGMPVIQAHTHSLWKRLVENMCRMRHLTTQNRVCVLYGLPDEPTQEQLASALHGPIIAFNLLRDDGVSWVGYSEVEKFAALEKIQVRTGCFCNPGACEQYLQLTPAEIKRNLASGHVCWDDKDIIDGKPTGAVRVSLPYFATESDINKFLAFLKKYFVSSFHEALSASSGAPETIGPIIVQKLVVYPIKSCSGFEPNTWPLGPDGLLYDREWTLIDEEGSYVNQKRLPSLALITSRIDAQSRNLVVSAPSLEDLVISLDFVPEDDAILSVCGDNCEGDAYPDEINDWFRRAVGERLILVRKKQNEILNRSVKRPHHHSSSSSKDSPSEKRRLGFANEAQFLLISLASVRDLAARLHADPIASNESADLSYENFRANIVIDGAGLQPYAEEKWPSIMIGNAKLLAIGQCNRCSMICVDKTTGQIKREPLRTLANYRRDKGTIPFGVLFVEEKWEDASQQPLILSVGSQIVILRD